MQLFFPVGYGKGIETNPTRVYDVTKFQKNDPEGVKPLVEVCKEYRQGTSSWIGKVKKHLHQEDQIFENMCMFLISQRFSLKQPYEYHPREHFVGLLMNEYCHPDDSKKERSDANKIAGRVVSNLIKANFMTPTNPKRKRNGSLARMSTFNPYYPTKISSS